MSQFDLMCEPETPDVRGVSGLGVEDLYRSIVESIPHFIFRKDLQGRFTYVNQRFCDLIDQHADYVIGRTDFDFFPAPLAAKYQDDDEHLLRTLEPFETIEAFQKPNLEKIWVHVVKTPAFDAHGELVGIQGIFRDATEQKLREEALIRNRDFLTALLDHIPDAIYFKDAQSRFMMCSRSVAARLGLNPEDMIGRTDFDLFEREHAEVAFRDEQQILRTGEPIIAKAEKEHWRDGQDVWVLTTKVPLRNKLGIVVGTIGISKEITELKRAEETMALARDTALESARLKSEFLANMSHEIRTPMNAIIGMTGLLLETQLTPDQRDFAETVRSSAGAMLDLINDILDFSKIEAGKLAIETIDFDLTETVEGTMDFFAQKAQTQGIELVLWQRGDVPRWLRGDPGRLRQVLVNLIGNAVKFTERGEVIVEVSVREEDASRAELQFSVRDTGVGIPAEAHSRIFQSFAQADGSTTRKYGGTGLGLAISKQLVELMGGEIGFSSEPGRGSVFWFSLPLARQASARTSSLPAKLEAQRVLIVEDNAAVRRMLCDFCAARRMRAEVVESLVLAGEAITVAASSRYPFGFVLVDQGLWSKNASALAFPRTGSGSPSARIVLLSNLGPAAASGEPGGLIAATISKPLKASRLEECFLGLLEKACVGSSPAQVPARAAASGMATSRPVRILLAEDNIVNRKVALRQLAQIGLTADAVENGLLAVRRLEIEAYDIVLLDCQMPEMDGFEVARTVRAWEKDRALPGTTGPAVQIIAMTANALAGDREKCLAAGMNDYLAKPVRVDDLRAAIERALGQLSLTSASPAAVPPANAPAALDSSVLQQLRELASPDQPNPLVELIDLFLADLPERLKAIQEAAAKNDARALHAAAHTLKGSAANLGAVQLSEFAKRILRLALDAKLDEARTAIPQLELLASQAREALHVERNR